MTTAMEEAREIAEAILAAVPGANVTTYPNGNDGEWELALRRADGESASCTIWQRTPWMARRKGTPPTGYLGDMPFRAGAATAWEVVCDAVRFLDGAETLSSQGAAPPG